MIGTTIVIVTILFIAPYLEPLPQVNNNKVNNMHLGDYQTILGRFGCNNYCCLHRFVAAIKRVKVSLENLKI